MTGIAAYGGGPPRSAGLRRAGRTPVTYASAPCRAWQPDDLFRASAASNSAGCPDAAARPDGWARKPDRRRASLARSLGVPIVEADATSWLGLLALAEGERERGIRLITEATDVIRRNHLDRLATGALSMTAQALVLALAG